MRASRARIEDVEAIGRLIDDYARRGWLLARSREEIREKISDFLVLNEGGKIAGCVALEGCGPHLVEVRSLAVDLAERNRGLGRRLLREAMAKAGRRGYAKIFAVTRAPEFFFRSGFWPVERRSLKEKVERDCARCPLSAHCRLTGVAAPVVRQSVTLSVPAVEAAFHTAP